MKNLTPFNNFASSGNPVFALFPHRAIKRAQWTIEGEGDCCNTTKIK
jgi:hypothetical protein